MMRGSLNRVRSMPSEDNTDRPRTKKARGGEPTHNKEPERETNSRDMAVVGLDTGKSDHAKGSSGRQKLVPVRRASLDTAKRDHAKGSSERQKLVPARSFPKTTQSQVKHLDKMAESKMDMDSMSLKDMLRFLDEEEVTLTQLQSKMSEELSRLQVEEHVFLHTLKIYGETHDGNKSNENQQQNSREDQELINALNLALKESNQSKADNSDKGKVACE